MVKLRVSREKALKMIEESAEKVTLEGFVEFARLQHENAYQQMKRDAVFIDYAQCVQFGLLGKERLEMDSRYLMKLLNHIKSKESNFVDIEQLHKMVDLLYRIDIVKSYEYNKEGLVSELDVNHNKRYKDIINVVDEIKEDGMSLWKNTNLKTF